MSDATLVSRDDDLCEVLAALVARDDAERLVGAGIPLAELARSGLQGEASLVPLRPASRRRIAAAFELARRREREGLAARPAVQGAVDAWRLVRPLFADESVEVFRLMLLDARNRLLSMPEISRGTLSTSLVHPREVYRPAILAGAAAIIVAHNHPSGVAEPSAQDHAVTGRLARAGRILGIPMLDHVIVGGDGYHSYRECGDPLLEE